MLHATEPNRIAGVILVLAGLLRALVAFATPSKWISTDSVVYLDMASGILTGDPISWFPNGYPLFIALVQLLAGADRLPATLIGINVLLATATVWLTYIIARHFVTPPTALLCMALIAIYPNQLQYVRQILTEVPTAFLLLVATWLLVRLHAAGGGLAFGLAALVRSSLLVVAPLNALYLVLTKRRALAIWLLVGFALVLVGEQLAIGGGWLMASDNLGTNLLLATQSSSSQGIVFSVDAFSAEQQAAPLQTYLRHLTSEPLTFVGYRLSALWELWGPWPNDGNSATPRSAISRLLLGIRFPLFLAACVTLWRQRRHHNIWLLGLPILSLTLVHTAFFATARFTHPVEPFVTILALTTVDKFMPAAWQRL